MSIFWDEVGGGDLFFDDEDVFCVNVESFDVLYIRDKEILRSIEGRRWGGPLMIERIWYLGRVSFQM